jgi:HEAT repeat protein
MEKFIEITDDDISEVSKTSSKELVDVFNQLIKTVKAKLVYPASSKLPYQFKETLFSSLTSLLEDRDDIEFRIEADSITSDEHQVYRAASKTDNFAHPFFRDGIVGFKFKSGLTFSELERFVDIASQMTRAAMVEDDFATLLWEAGFDHISYELMDDFLDIETFEYGADSLKSGKTPSKGDLKSIFENEVDLNLTEEDFDLNSEKNKARNVPGAYRDIEDNVAQFLSSITKYDEADRSAVERMLKDDFEFDHIRYAVDILFEILGVEADTAAYTETLDLIAKVGTDFIRLGDFKSAIKVIDRSKELELVLEKVKDPKHEKLSSLVEKFAASEKIRVLVDYLNKGKDVDYVDVTKFLKILPWQAVDPLVWALGELEHFPARRSVCQALEILARDHVDVLAKGMDSPRWYVVRNVVSILGKIGDPRAFGYFRRSISHPDIRIRKETIVSAGGIASDEAAQFLVTALKDVEEKIQTLALREIVNRKMIAAFPELSAIITGKGFKNRSSEQIRELLTGYAVLGNAEAFPLLKKMIKQKSLLPSEKMERIKIHAIRALRHIDLKEAGSLLQQLSDSRNRKIADMARRSLSKFRGDSKDA